MNGADTKASFALWQDTQTHWKVQYSLPVFNEIDFEVNEGYRRIPHGGVEVGGVLYGRLDPGLVTVSAFRPIECDHAAGPSFLLSESDLSRLASSIRSASQDEELKELVPVGWFIAHTRGPLQMTSRELDIFGQFFPEPGRITVLIKPERFKPTRFAFLLRNESGRMPVDGTDNVVLLPLSGRTGKRPESSPASPPVLKSPPPERRAPSNSNLAVQQESADAAASILDTPREVRPPAAIPEEVFAPVSAQPFSAPAIPVSLPPVSSARQPQPAHEKRLSVLLVTILLVAALLGCGIGYWAYLQLPATVITLHLQKRQSDLLVVWDPIQTRGASYSAMRINDGKPVPLSADQKGSGIAEIPLTSGDIKVEIMSRRWARESRGIVRLLQATPVHTP